MDSEGWRNPAIARLLIGTLVLVVGGLLAVVIAIRRRQRVRDVLRHDADRLFVAAKALAVVIIVLVFAVLIIVNNA